MVFFLFEIGNYKHIKTVAKKQLTKQIHSHEKAYQHTVIKLWLSSKITFAKRSKMITTYATLE